MTNPSQVMVFTPHPDDAEFGIAGTAVRWAREGTTVIYVVCTNGDKGTSDINMKLEELVKTREKEQLAAAEMLGIREVIFMRYPDQNLEDTPQFRKEVVRLLRMYRPDTVVTADPYRRYLWHRDHRITGRVVLDAIFPYASNIHSYPDMLEQGLEAHRVREILLWGSENPNYRSNITDTYDIKIAALCCHSSQMGESEPAEVADRMRQRYKIQAEGEDYELAEAFHRLELCWEVDDFSFENSPVLIPYDCS